MGDTNGGKFERVLYNLNVVRRKSGDKYKKAMNRYVDILKKESKGAPAKWIAKTKEKAQLRLRKYGITSEQINSYIQSKGLKDLVSKKGK